MPKSIKSAIVNGFLWIFSPIGVIAFVYLLFLLIGALGRAISQAGPPQTNIPVSTADGSIPLLEPDEKILQLFLAPPVCMLPCWRGFTPGETTYEDVSAFFADYQVFDVAVPSTGNEPARAAILVGDQRSDLPQVSFGFAGNILTGIVFEDSTQKFSKAYNLSGILSAYGPPQQVYVRPFDEKYITIGEGLSGPIIQENPAPLSLVIILSYPEIGAELTYQFNADETCCVMRANLVQAKTMRLRLQEAQAFLSSQVGENDCEDGNNNLRLFVADATLTQGFCPIDGVSDLSLERFYQRFSNLEDGLDWLQISTKPWRSKGLQPWNTSPP